MTKRRVLTICVVAAFCAAATGCLKGCRKTPLQLAMDTGQTANILAKSSFIAVDYGYKKKQCDKELHDKAVKYWDKFEPMMAVYKQTLAALLATGDVKLQSVFYQEQVRKQRKELTALASKLQVLAAPLKKKGK